MLRRALNVATRWFGMKTSNVGIALLVVIGRKKRKKNGKTLTLASAPIQSYLGGRGI